MKALLINSPSVRRKIVRDMAGGLGFDGHEETCLPPLDLMYYAATLSHVGFDVSLLDADAENLSVADVLARAKSLAPDRIVATLSLPTLRDDAAFIRRLRADTGAMVFVKTGIRYPSLLREILVQSSADVVVHGECDLIIDQILRRERNDGTAFLHGEELIIKEETLLDELDRLPNPARNLINSDLYSYQLLGRPATSMQTSRGCPFPCAYYCPYPLVQGNRWRARSAEQVVREIEEIVSTTPVRKILFRDATFTLDRDRALKIAALIQERNLQIEWWCETRLNCVDRELLQAMRQAGLRGMNVGVETGDPAIMTTRAKAGVTIERVREIREAARMLRIKMHFLLMTGLPGETKRSLFQTFRLVVRTMPDSVGVTTVTPYPGTPLYEEALKRGWIKGGDWSRFGGHQGVMRTDLLAKTDLLIAQRLILRGHALLSRGTLLGRTAAKALEGLFCAWSRL
ncbi:MAG: B12-binding domain-containing radical SAM protein [Nitrospiraceae bacterium]|nr:B12-binding domain-containing radical SAM protein [Nitrospiraceae bacterium]